jgi:hypothetical protein
MCIPIWFNQKHICVMQRSLKYFNYRFCFSKRCKDTLFSTFLDVENWTFGFIRHQHGNEAILIEIASLLFIFCWLPTNSWTKVLFFPPEENRHNKQNKILFASEVNEKLRPILPKEPLWRLFPLAAMSLYLARSCVPLALPPPTPSLKEVSFKSFNR